jgi:parallel beta-helix repeat protein
VRLAVGICAVAVGFFVAGVGAAAAGPVSCGAVITTSTTLHNDLIDCPGGGIVIGADNITLNLNGHTIDGLGSAAPFGSDGIDNTGGYDNIVITNGTVTEFQFGLALVGTTRNVVRRLSVSGNTSDAIFVDGFAFGNSSDNRFAHNRVFDNIGDGIHLRGSNGNVIRRNSATANRGRGIDLSFSSQSNSVVHNVLAGNRNQGIFLSELADRNDVVRNLFVGNSSSGIAITGSNMNNVVANTIARNGGGIDVLSGTDPRTPANENVLTRNDVIANSFDGIFVYGPSEFMGQQIPGATGTVVLANRASANGDDGIDVRSAATTITRNRANRNVDLGIDAVAGVIDGGGNRASGNGNPLQCVNVVCS